MVRQAHHERRSEDFEKALNATRGHLPTAAACAIITAARRFYRE